MREVASKELLSLIRAAERTGVSFETATRGLTCSTEQLLDSSERVAWADWLTLVDNLNEFWTDDSYREYGARYLRSPLVRGSMVILRQLLSLKELYIFPTRGEHGAGKQNFSCIDSSCKEIGPHHLDYRFVMHPGCAPSHAFFAIVEGFFVNCPLLFGLPPAKVDITESATGATLIIDYPPGGGFVYHARRTLISVFSGRAAAHELAASNEALFARYQDLQSARDQLERQARHMRAAAAIGQLVHGERDLPRTLDVIAGALVENARFDGAELAIDTTFEGIAISERVFRGQRSATPPLALPIRIQQSDIGTLTLWSSASGDATRLDEINDHIAPTIFMAIDDALTFTVLVDYRQKLEIKVEERTAQLRDAHDRLALSVSNLTTAQTVRDRIFANINHEIRTPLSLIKLASSDIRTRLGATLDEPSRQDVASIETSVARLLRLIDGLLLLAAGQEGKLKLKLTRVDLGQIMHKTVDLWSPAVAAAGLRIDYLGPQHCDARIDEGALERILGNLISNAVKFTPRDGFIQIQMQLENDTISIAVRDTGVGLDEEFRKRIFGRFEQGRPAVRGGGRGSGIGLSLVKELVEAHSGTVTATSNNGGGTTFTLVLPRVTQVTFDDPGISVTALERPEFSPEQLGQFTNPRRLGPDILAPADGGRATVLLAEDDGALADATARLLAQHYRVIVANDGLAALRLAREHLPDMLLSDVEMPGMSGIELSRKFREISGNRLAPTLLVTAHSDLTSRLEGFDAGAVDYITKPYEPRELLARVHSQLAIRDLALRLSDTEKLASLGILAAGLAHELRNPANAVVNALEPLESLLPPEVLVPGTATAELLECVRTGAHQLRALSEQLLGFVRPGELQTQQEETEKMLDRALSMVAETVKHCVVQKDYSYTGKVQCAAPLLVQVLTNLLENAAHATEGAAAPVRRITIATRLTEEQVEIDIGDNGPGVPSDLRDKIFVPFFTTKDPGKGTGLGLSTARTVMGRQHGSINLVSTSEGATFRLSLPVHPVHRPVH